MSPRARVAAVTGLVAAVAVAVVVGVAASSGGEPPPLPRAQPRPGSPPLALDLGLRADPEARALRRALALYDDGRRRQAAALFGRHESLEARVGQEVAAWPDGTIDGLGRLAALHPKSALVQLELGLALLWAGEPGSADAWREAAALEPDTYYAVVAGNLLHPSFAPKLPTFVPSEPLPATLAGQPPARQLAILRERALTGPAGAKILYGVALQRLYRPVSARRVFDAAARQAPDDPEALAAAAVGRFDKSDPSAAFSRLGPLARRFPQAATVRFHLGLLLLWIGQLDRARTELRLAERAQPGSPLAREAGRYLATLQRVGR